MRDIKDEQPKNAFSLIVVIPSEMTTVVSSWLIALGVTFISPEPVIVNDVMEHSENASFPIGVTLSGVVAEGKEERPSDELISIVVTLLGIVRDFKEEHSENAFSLIVVIPSEMTTVVSSWLIALGVTFISPEPVIVNDVMEHSENALFPIVVTRLGIVRDFKEEHPKKALSLIVVIPSEMTTVVSFWLIALGVTFISPEPVIVNDVMEH